MKNKITIEPQSGRYWRELFHLTQQPEQMTQHSERVKQHPAHFTLHPEQVKQHRAHFTAQLTLISQQPFHFTLYYTQPHLLLTQVKLALVSVLQQLERMLRDYIQRIKAPILVLCHPAHCLQALIAVEQHQTHFSLHPTLSINELLHRARAPTN